VKSIKIPLVLDFGLAILPGHVYYANLHTSSMSPDNRLYFKVGRLSV